MSGRYIFSGSNVVSDGVHSSSHHLILHFDTAREVNFDSKIIGKNLGTVGMGS